MIGSYILIFELKHDFIISIGKKGRITFRKGYYVYVGSALNGLEKRIKRHLKTNKRKHWHIDYLLEIALIKYIFIKESINKEECNIAKSFNKQLFPIKSFGNSDCRCKSHLFYGEKNTIFYIVDELKMNLFLNEKA